VTWAIILAAYLAGIVTGAVAMLLGSLAWVVTHPQHDRRLP